MCKAKEFIKNLYNDIKEDSKYLLSAEAINYCYDLMERINIFLSTEEF